MVLATLALHRKTQLDYGKLSSVLLHSDFASKLMGDLLTEGKPKSAGVVVHLFVALLDPELFEWHEQSLLDFVGDPDSSVDDLSFEDEVLTSRRVTQSVALEQYHDAPLGVVVLDGVLNDVENDEFVLLPVQLDFSNEVVVASKVNLQLVLRYHAHEGIQHLLKVDLREGLPSWAGGELALLDLHALDDVLVVVVHQNARLLSGFDERVHRLNVGQLLLSNIRTGFL